MLHLTLFLMPVWATPLVINFFPFNFSFQNIHTLEMLEPCMLGPNFWSALRSLGRVCFLTFFVNKNIKTSPRARLPSQNHKWRKRTWNVYTLPHLVLMPRMYAVSCASATQRSACMHNRIACKLRVSGQCGKACEFSECLIGCKRDCTDYMQTFFSQECFRMNGCTDHSWNASPLNMLTYAAWSDPFVKRKWYSKWLFQLNGFRKKYIGGNWTVLPLNESA